jgi:hypothetical protein
MPYLILAIRLPVTIDSSGHCRSDAAAQACVRGSVGKERADLDWECEQVPDQTDETFPFVGHVSPPPPHFAGVQLLRGLCEKITQFLLIIRSWTRLSTFPAAHRVRVRPNLLCDILLGPTSFLTCLRKQRVMGLHRMLVPSSECSPFDLYHPHRSVADSH